MAGRVTLKFWHGGVLKKDNHGHMRYEGGMGKSCSADPDELCWWDLRDLACSCGPYEKEMIEGLYYLIPGLSLDEGLRKVYNDDEVRKMGELVVETRCIQLYVIHGDKNVAKKDVVGTQISQTKDPAPAQVPIEVSPKKNNNRPKKLTPKRPNKASLKPCRTSPRNAQLVDPTLLESPATLIVGDSVKSLQLHPQNRSERCSANPSQISLETTPLSYTTGPSKAATEPPIVPESFPLFERQIVPETYQWEDERPDSPIPLKELLGDDAWSDDDSDGDPEYEPDSDSLKGGGEVADDASDASDFDDLSDGLEEIEEGDDVEVVDDEGVETSDDELQTARERVKGFNTKVREIALKLQQDAVEGRLGQQQIRFGGQPSVEEPATEYHSEYEDSDEEIDTPPESGDDETIAQRRTKRSLLVGNDTDFKVFKWRVGQRFPSRDEFKSAVAKYGILQGRNLTFAIITGIASVFPNAEHRHCARHIFALWHKSFRGDEMKLMFWKIVKAYNLADYDDALQQLSEVSNAAAIAFRSYNPNLFCRAFMGTSCKADVMTNNMAETFNGRPRKNRRKDPFEDPKRPGKLSKHGMEMTCSVCNNKGHNKRRCPNKDRAEPTQPQPKRPRGRPRLQPTSGNQQHPPTISTHPHHHAITAESTLLGRGGELLGVEEGAEVEAQARELEQQPGEGVQLQGGVVEELNQGRGRGGATSGGRGRRGRGRATSSLPQGFGVLIGADGSTMTNVPGSSRGPRVVTDHTIVTSQTSQASTTFTSLK
ncbi:Prohead core protein protease [Bienertia sinuspersici]